MFGVRARRVARTLATTSARAADGELWAGRFDDWALLRIPDWDGTIERRWNIPRRLRDTLGDLAIGRKGDVFVTDSNEPVLYWLRSGADTLESIRSPLFRLAGRASWPVSGRHVFSIRRRLLAWILRVDLTTKSVIRVADAPGSTSLGCDGSPGIAGATSLCRTESRLPGSFGSC
jgi:hypothetical protein